MIALSSSRFGLVRKSREMSAFTRLGVGANAEYLSGEKDMKMAKGKIKQ